MRSLVVMLLLSACASSPINSNAAPYVVVESDTGSFHIEARTSPDQPPTHGVLIVDLTIIDRAKAPVVGAQVQVTPWMPSHAHGTSVTPTVTDMGQGHYRANNVDLYMPGSWQLRTVIAGAVTDNATLSIDVR